MVGLMMRLGSQFKVGKLFSDSVTVLAVFAALLLFLRKVRILAVLLSSLIISSSFQKPI